MDDPDIRVEAETELTAVREALDEMEVRTLLSGEYDEREALVDIRAEAGGTDAFDFAERLLQRMYLRRAERHGQSTEVYETSYAETVGVRSTTFVVKAPYAYGSLSTEQGRQRTGWCTGRRSTARAATRSPWRVSRCYRSPRKLITSNSTRPNCASMSPVPRAPVVSVSLPTRRSGSHTFRPALS
ncbi:peptide chain release factor 2 [Embleya hyalina]|uniref:Peptide chain release factor 2 n=1 Tax=Embleya hyalina TaxID=516124 RepID=A0A401Z612_9ACTN|nr:peptide chain release factor 2 [Embleya hyalina]